MHLIDFKSDEYEVHIAETVEEAKKLDEAGFEHYDTVGYNHLYRKRKGQSLLENDNLYLKSESEKYEVDGCDD